MELVTQTVPIGISSSRPLANFPPNIWGDRFLQHMPDSNEDRLKQLVAELKEEVKRELKEASNDYIGQVKMVDAIQRLGIEYHFEEEVDQALQNLSENFDDLCKGNHDMYLTALSFRLLRQHGYRVSTNIFDKFKDEKGVFKVPDIQQAMGVLELFEATHLRVHGEDTLDHAYVFSRNYLESVLPSLTDPAEKQVHHALYEYSNRRGYTRLEARFYISIYEQTSHHQGLLRLAKLDYNLLQSMHKKELSEHCRQVVERSRSADEVVVCKRSVGGDLLLECTSLSTDLLQKTTLLTLPNLSTIFSSHETELSVKLETDDISLWWKSLEVPTKLSFVRDRLVEIYFWNVGVYFEPEYALGRKFFTKLQALISVIDDCFDAYGTLEELSLFTEAIERWSFACLDQLPDYLKIVYKALLEVFVEIENELIRQGKSYRVSYGIEAMKVLVGAYLDEIKWREAKYKPTMQEYMQVATKSCGYLTLVIISFLGMGDIATRESFDWVLSKPDVVQASVDIGRLADDIGSHEFEKEREHIPTSVECYMEENKVSEQEAIQELNNRIELAWKNLNEAFFRPTKIPTPQLYRILNLARVLEVIYGKGDWYTHVGPELQNFIKQLFVDPLLIP